MEQQHPTQLLAMLVLASGLTALVLGVLLTALLAFGGGRKVVSRSRLVSSALRLGPVLLFIGLVLVSR